MKMYVKKETIKFVLNFLEILIGEQRIFRKKPRETTNSKEK